MNLKNNISKLKKIRLFFSLVLLVIILGSCSNKPSKLTVAPIFNHKMVLQQQQKLPIFGTAISGTKITVQLNDDIKETISDNLGNWKLLLPKQQLGKPTSLIIKTKDTTIVYNDILIGEVWLASGQSNMHLDLHRTLNGDAVAKKATNPNIRIFNMRPTYPTGKGGIHTKEELENLNNNKYFKIESWEPVTPNSTKYFSAVAYYFANKLQKDLNVPIGIIHNAVPGSPTESWISKKVLVSNSKLSKLVSTPWQDNEKNGVGKILLDIAKKQVSLSNNKNQKHPWMPTFCYKNGIEPIKEFAIKGIIWYQGESNAGNIELHEELLKTMVKSWRNDWKQKELPFYYVQLTSREDRPTWPEFRDSQRRLLDEIPNAGMAVISDVGDRQDTHAKNKKPVGERLALLALGKTYHKLKYYESPLFDTVKAKDEIIITFKGAFKELKTKNNKPVTGFEIGIDSSFFSVNAQIKANKISIKVPKQYHPNTIVRYAWKPYTEANLVNEIGLPVSTFKTTKIYENK